MIELKSSFVCCVENDAGNHNFKPRDQADIDLMQERGAIREPIEDE